MNFEQFYSRLDSVSSEEIRECLRRVTVAAEKRGIVKEQRDNSLQESQIKEQMWFLHAVGNKFGSGMSNFSSLKELREATASLFIAEEVGQFVVSVNKSIKEEVAQLNRHRNGSSASSKCNSNFIERLLEDSSIRTVETDKARGDGTDEHFDDKQFEDEDELEDEDEEESDDANNTRVLESASNKVLCQTGEVEVPQKGSSATPTKFSWTSAKDKLLLIAIEEHKAEGWAAVAKAFGHQSSAATCQYRWSSYLQPKQEGLRGDYTWTAQEEAELRELVGTFTVEPYWKPKEKCMSRVRVNWSALGEAIGRIPSRCKEKWRNMKKHSHSSGSADVAADEQRTTRSSAMQQPRLRSYYRDEESAESSGDSSYEDVGPPRKRYRNQYSDCSIWTTEMDLQLAEVVAQYQQEGWAVVAEHMGSLVTAVQCKSRWHNRVKKLQAERGK